MFGGSDCPRKCPGAILERGLSKENVRDYWVNFSGGEKMSKEKRPVSFWGKMSGGNVGGGNVRISMQD